MEFDYGFEYAMPDAMEGAAIGAAGATIAIFAILYLVILSVGLVCYILNAVGLYRIAKRRGIHHAWLAWIPIGSEWLLGSIADHYQYIAKQKITKRRKALLILDILLCVISVVLVVAVVAVIMGMSMDPVGLGSSVVSFLIMGVGYLALLGLSVALMVFYYIACFDLFRSCKPGNEVLFLVLGIIFSAIMPIFIFVCSKSDAGMPERRQPAPQPLNEAPYTPPQNDDWTQL